MIYCSNKEGKYFIDDELKCVGLSKFDVDFINELISLMKITFKPQDGFPTYLVADKLESMGFEIIQVELPLVY